MKTVADGSLARRRALGLIPFLVAGVWPTHFFPSSGGGGGGCQVGGDETDGTNGSVGDRRGLGGFVDGDVGSGEEMGAFAFARRL